MKNAWRGAVAQGLPLRKHLGSGALLALLMAAGFVLSPGARSLMANAAIGMWDAVCFTDNGLLFSTSAADKAAGRPATIVTPLSCTALASVPGKSVTTALVEFPPLAYSGPHRHPGEVTAVVIEGTLLSQLNATAPVLFAAGQTWFEPPGTLHAFVENPDPTRPAKLMAFYVAETGCGALSIPEPQAK